MSSNWIDIVFIFTRISKTGLSIELILMRRLKFTMVASVFLGDVLWMAHVLLICFCWSYPTSSLLSAMGNLPARILSCSKWKTWISGKILNGLNVYMSLFREIELYYIYLLVLVWTCRLISSMLFFTLHKLFTCPLTCQINKVTFVYIYTNKNRKQKFFYR